MSDNVIQASDASFESEVLTATLPVLVDFWATWCGPCRAVAPILEEVAKEYAGKIKVVKIDVDQNPEIPARFGIRGIPTLKVFKQGEAVATHVGSLSKAQLTALIDGHL